MSNPFALSCLHFERVQIALLDMNWGLWPENYQDTRFCSEGANSLGVPRHAPLSQYEMAMGQSHGACPRPRPFSVTVFRTPYTREGRGQFYLDCTLGARPSVSILGAALVTV